LPEQVVGQHNGSVVRPGQDFGQVYCHGFWPKTNDDDALHAFALFIIREPTRRRRRIECQKINDQSWTWWLY